MFVRICLLGLIPIALILIHRSRSRVTANQANALRLCAVVAVSATWAGLEWLARRDAASELNRTAAVAAAIETYDSDTCIECHKSRHASWYRSFHRTMTREATPENVKADFNNAVYTYQGVTSRMYRRDDRFFIETIDPAWGKENLRLEREGVPVERRPTERRLDYSVDRLVGSHWFQQLLHRDERGRYKRLPFVYHLAEKRWLHLDGAFLSPETPNFFARCANWNDFCLFCHNTRPMKNPEPITGESCGFNTEVSELGISCEACHGPAAAHVRAHRNAGHATLDPGGDSPDPTIINPARLSVKRADDICAHCHGAGLAPRPDVWDPDADGDPYRPGRELAMSHHMYWSERELTLTKNGMGGALGDSGQPGAPDGRFWGDGTPLTTAHEYQGMALSKCYQGGEGKMSCLTCHAMHGGDPNHQLKEGMRTNEACFGCHEPYRKKLMEHTHHPANSPGSLCHNCHMPHQVYSLLDTHRTHRIGVPRVRDSIDTGKPHACNLCHLDKSLGWTNDRLQAWYGTKPEALAPEERTIASSVLHLMRSDARSRAVVAGAFGRPDAQQASGRDWPGLLLIRVLEEERYPAVRYLAYRSLKSLPAAAGGEYDYLASPSRRAEQLRSLRILLRALPRPDRTRYPDLPLSADGMLRENVLDELLKSRKDPDIYVNE